MDAQLLLETIRLLQVRQKAGENVTDDLRLAVMLQRQQFAETCLTAIDWNPPKKKRGRKRDRLSAVITQAACKNLCPFCEGGNRPLKIVCRKSVV